MTRAKPGASVAVSTGFVEPAPADRGAGESSDAYLARLEARIALGALVRRARSFEVDRDAAVRVHSINVRGFARLPVTVEAR